MSASVSRHFVAEKVKALCVVSDVRYASETLQEEYELLPLVATGGWDNETNHVSLHLPVRPTRDERELRREFGASSAGGIFAFRVSSSAGDDGASMTDGDSAKPLDAFSVPQWEQVFAGTAATCVEVSENRTSLVTASAGGALAWLKLDDAVSIEKIENKDTSRLPINAVKFLGRDSVVATAGSTPGSQLRVWDLSVNNQFPVTTCGAFWDRRKFDAPFRTEGYHQRAVRALKLHSASPRYLFTGGDDAVVNCWNFHHGRNPRNPVEYERYSESSGSQISTPFGSLGASSSNGFSKGLGGLQVQPIVSGSLPWNALAVHAESDTLVAGSDAQSVMIVQQVSKWKQ
ncbi:hypothetical protein AM588_10010706 [Phytophthora nicotianae]|uniref:Uncharacterized protein n=1 Tax=Phytophthora nicotianae TaxID=4792 RepID=A0A0W8DSU3_PHYNI|nr:hypothetical protein AM588_10010706 [Phytophthora nicotianae]